MNIKNNKGFVILISSYIIVAILLILGVAFFSRSLSEDKISERQKNSIQAVSIAEAGLERAYYDLKQDFVNDLTNPSWIDGDINSIACVPDYNNFYIFHSSTSLGTGSYIVELKNVTGKSDEVWVRSTGTVGDINKILQTYIKIKNFNCWNNAIFAGIGESGRLINGNVDVRGSVHLLGDSLLDTDLAMDMSGSGQVGNNYMGIPAELSSRIPACPTTLFNGEVVESLDTFVRIKNGRAGLSGTANIGDPNIPANAYKETVNEVYITDGYGGNKGATNVYSDNGSSNIYDLGDSVGFSSLQDPYGGYATYQAYLRANALVISNPADLNKLSNIKPNSNFNFSNAKGTIRMDGNGNLTINGIVYVDGGSLNMDKQGNDKTINYSGSGSILVTGNVGINVNLLTPNAANSFPNNIIGIMTPNRINFNEAQIKIMGLFYAENEIISQKQTSVAGSFVSNYFNMGNQVPNIYQVPDTVNHLPPGLIAGSPIWVIKVVSWKEE